jgi:hypothetical protein
MEDSINSKTFMSNISINNSSYSGVLPTTTNNNNTNINKKNDLNYKHLINFNQLAEKLKKIQKIQQQQIPSCKSSKQHSLIQTIDKNKKHLIYPRSASNFDNNRETMSSSSSSNTNKTSAAAAAAAAALVDTLQTSGVNQKNSKSNTKTSNLNNSKKINKNKIKHDLSSLSSSSLSSFESESFEMSCSVSPSSSSTSLNSCYADRNNAHKQQQQQQHHHYQASYPSLSAAVPLSTDNLRLNYAIISNNTTPNKTSSNNNNNNKQILIRREKSIGYIQPQAQQAQQQASNKMQSSFNMASSSFNTLYLNHNDISPTTPPKMNRSRPIKNSKSSSVSSTTTTNNMINSQTNNNNTSSTTSGIECLSKNSNQNFNDKESRSDMVNTAVTADSVLQYSSSSMEINELRTRLYQVESDLHTERKKLMHEKDLKKYMTYELKSRYEAEKLHALKQLEQKLNAEKLNEINTLKESFDLIKHKNLETYLYNLKLKLKEKSEKCLQLEKMLKEEQTKNNQLFSKSIEVIQKYNQEIKNKKQTVELLTAQTQTTCSNNNSIDLDFNLLKKRLFMIHTNLSNQTYSNKAKEEIDLTSLLNQIENFSRQANISLNESDNLKELNEKLNNELIASKEAKLKVEALYKVKAKSDLNARAQIKKCQINFDLEMMRFKNEFNNDLVRHLENQNSIKSAEILELNSKLENVSNLINNSNNYDNNYNEFLNSLSNIMNYSSENKQQLQSKKVPLNVLFIKETDSMISNNSLNNRTSIRRIDSSPSKYENNNNNNSNNNEKNKILQDEMSKLNVQTEIMKLDKQLSEMKSLKIKLAVSI